MKTLLSSPALIGMIVLLVLGVWWINSGADPAADPSATKRHGELADDPVPPDIEDPSSLPGSDELEEPSPPDVAPAAELLEPEPTQPPVELEPEPSPPEPVEPIVATEPEVDEPSPEAIDPEPTVTEPAEQPDTLEPETPDPEPTDRPLGVLLGVARLDGSVGESDAKLRLLTESGDHSAAIGDDGTFRIEAIPPGRYRLFLELPNTGAEPARILLEDLVEVHTVAQERELEFTRHSLRLRLRTRGGAALAGRRLSIAIPEPEDLTPWSDRLVPPVETDPHGWALFDPIPALPVELLLWDAAGETSRSLGMIEVRNDQRSTTVDLRVE